METTLGELARCVGGFIQTGPFGSQLHASDYATHGAGVVMPQDIRDGRIASGQMARISPDHVDRLTRHRLRAGDIVYSRRGDVEKCALVLEQDLPAICGTGCLLVRTDDRDVIDPLFLSYLLRSESSTTWIKAHAVGATMPNLNTAILAAVPLTIPVLVEQRAIAEVLGALDDKIAANESDRQNRAALAGMLYATHSTARAPLSSLARFVNGRNFTGNASGDGRMVVRIAEMNGGPGASTVYNIVDADEDHVAHPGDLLLAWSGSLGVARWFLDEALVNQHIFKVIPDQGWPAWVCAAALETVIGDFRAIAADKATTMGHIKRRDLDTVVRVPNPAELRRLDGSMSVLWDLELARARESQTLAALRDTLLPGLMDGSIRVKDAEVSVSEAL